MIADDATLTMLVGYTNQAGSLGLLSQQWRRAGGGRTTDGQLSPPNFSRPENFHLVGKFPLENTKKIGSGNAPFCSIL